MANLINLDIIKRSQSHCTNWYNTNNEPTVQFIRHRAMETDDNNSPPQWGTNSPSPPKSPSHPLLSRSPSSDSRARAIAQGQWELMEMVRNMPESSYELSLKDLVENQETIDGLDQSLQKNDQDLNQKAMVNKSKRSESKKIVNNNSKGLFLNVGFPFSLESRKKKKKNNNNNNNKVGRNLCNNKVSPNKVDVTGEKDWWKKRFSGSRDSNGSGISSSSGGGGGTTTTVSSRGGSSGSGSGGGGRKRNGSPTGCWPFFCGGRESVE